MANYIIEGTISELSFDEGYFTICGSEDFSLKYDDKKYNVLCPEKISKENFATQQYSSCFILKQDLKFSTKNRNRNLLLQGSSLQKKVRVKIQFKHKLEKGELIIKDFSKPLPVFSIILLSD